jgi:D-alanyl-D-alanine carboxypeptidase/D-alanyl-D-alanine-endopeptidase (penicillin-binding protein 4)
MLRRVVAAVAVAILCAAAALSSAADRAPAAARQASLTERVAARVAAFEKGQTVVGLSVVDLRTGKKLLSNRADEPLPPASNQKILTSAFALAALGPGHKFVSGVFALDGDVIVYGSFDPTLGDRTLAADAGADPEAALASWAAAVRREMGPTVRNIVLCGRPRGQYRPDDWPAHQHGTWYGAPVAELNYNNNCFDVRIIGGVDALKAEVEPASRFISVTASLRKGTAAWSARMSDDASSIAVQGRAAGPSPVQNVPVTSPPLFFGRVFAEQLARAGVTVTGHLAVVPPSQVDFVRASPLAATTTALATAMARANKRSLNMAAECIFLRAGDGTWEGSAAIATRTLVREYGLAEKAITIRDGSGLSARNRVSADAMTTVLAALAKSDEFVGSLAVSGVDGTLSKRLDDEPYRGSVLGKTGYIAGVSALSGYVLGKDGKPRYAFAILCNRFAGLADAKDLEDGICRMLVDEAR